jgi:hypothetical protein
MAKAHLRVTKTTTKTRTKTKKKSNSKGNQKRCPTCGRYM